ncbi:hypothetical protein AVU38_gp134 [Ralstonia phage RSL2]|uniref:Uncharacterized protein n=1 Tax=Ralstonia phage RSL2 TaxID=1585840 RepID=A0A0A8J8W1_9CAUD|nr:hypothetical protein AVU38_gp134 [Ralstonia phage RSL2]BAQ02662.1 hypothetical protein [Ralstonia phage RSL2]
MDLVKELSFVIVILIGVLIIKHIQYKRAVSQLADNYKDERKYYKQLWADNELLRSYMDNKHMVWSDHAKEVINRRPLDPDLVILIRASDLYNLTQIQWREGHDNASSQIGKTMQMRYGIDNQEEEDGVARIRASFADKRFDNDFAKLVNACTAIAINYGQTQQIRDRLSKQIIDFRMYLSKKQRGERVNFPKT